jgi:hypothetical protein
MPLVFKHVECVRAQLKAERNLLRLRAAVCSASETSFFNLQLKERDAYLSHKFYTQLCTVLCTSCKFFVAWNSRIRWMRKTLWVVTVEEEPSEFELVTVVYFSVIIRQTHFSWWQNCVIPNVKLNMHLLEPSDSAICQTLTLTTLYERIIYLVNH